MANHLIQCHADGIIYDPYAKEWCILEIKSMNEERFKKLFDKKYKDKSPDEIENNF